MDRIISPPPTPEAISTAQRSSRDLLTDDTLELDPPGVARCLCVVVAGVDCLAQECQIHVGEGADGDVGKVLPEIFVEPRGRSAVVPSREPI